MNNKIKSKKKNSGSASSFKLIFIGIIVVYILSLIIPSGEFTRIDGSVDPDSFQLLEKTILSPFKIIRETPVTAYLSMGRLFITMMCVSATLAVIQFTGSLDIAIYRLTKKFEDKVLILIPILILFMGFMGTVGAMISTVIAFIPLGIVISRRLKVDNVYAVGIMLLGSYSGFMASPISPLTTAIAQEISGLATFSGFTFRAILTGIIIFVVAAYLLYYAYKVRKDPAKSVMDKIDFDSFGELEDYGDTKMTIRQILVVIVFMGSFLFFAYGSKNLGYGISDLAALMLPTGLVCGLIGGFTIEETVDAMIKGVGHMATPILFMIFTATINTILSLSGTMDSIVYYLSIPLGMLGHQLAAIGMFLSNAVINLAIPSGSGQAAVVMPIMAPLADVIGVSRQTAVLAFQLGDGFTNLLNPINFTLIGSLSIAKVSMKDWFKFITPIYVAFLVIICIALSVAVSIGY